MYVSSYKSVDMRINIVKNEQVKARGWTSARFSETPLQTFFDNIYYPFHLLGTSRVPRKILESSSHWL